jgi:hypothetical protein
VPHVIAVAGSTQLSDVAARIFTRDFYLALAVGKTIADAFSIGTCPPPSLSLSLC